MKWNKEKYCKTNFKILDIKKYFRRMNYDGN